MRSRRGQNSVEFVVLIGFLLLVFVGFYFVIQGKILEQQAVNHRAAYEQLADLFEQEVLLASQVEHGYRRSFDLPRTIDGEAYTMRIEDGDGLVINGTASDNEYIRFLSVKLVLADETGDGLLPVDQPVILQKWEGTVAGETAYWVYVRNDCESLEACPWKPPA